MGTKTVMRISHMPSSLIPTSTLEREDAIEPHLLMRKLKLKIFK